MRQCKKQRGRSSRLRRRGVVVAAGLWVMGGLAGLYFLFSGGFMHFHLHANRHSTAIQAAPLPSSPVSPRRPASSTGDDTWLFAQPPEPATIMLLGVDSREGEAARSDSLLLVRLNTAAHDARLLSIPRDTWVSVPGYGYTKINHAMAYGGVPLVKQTVERFLHIPVDYYVSVDFKGFRDIVDTLGGVEINVEKRMDYDDPTDGTHIHLAPGTQWLSGRQALDYARFRHDAQADTGRMRRQQALLKAIGRRALQPAQWGKLFQLSSMVKSHVQTDLPATLIGRLAFVYRHADPAQFESITIEGVNKISPVDGIWYFYTDEGARQKAVNRLLGEETVVDKQTGVEGEAIK